MMSSPRVVLASLIISASFVIIFSDNIQASTEKQSSLTPKIYVKLLRSRRRDHMTLIEEMLKSDYAKNYKMISLALEKIFQVIGQSNRTLVVQNYTPSEGFPTEQVKQDAVILLLENSCLVADILLHFPEISYRVLDKIPNWKKTINWCIIFVNNFPHIIDELIVELMDLVHQEINEDARTLEFINPYYEKVDTDSVIRKKVKERKKIKKGPRLTSRTEL